MSPDSKQMGLLKANPNGSIVSDETLPAFSLMLAHASGRSNIPDGEFSLLAIALKQNEVTVDEAFEAFWKAYGDPYVSQGRIEFRHLWKYISEKRGENEKQFAYIEMLREMDKAGVTTDAFECLDGNAGRPISLDSIGKPKWRYTK